MQTLRNAHQIARFVLVWFALSLGVAIASPLIKPQSMQLVCTGTGSVKVIAGNGDSDSTLASGNHTLDCPLCAGVGAPPVAVLLNFAQAAPRALPHPRVVAEPKPQVSAAPPPARGPPALL